MNFRKIIIISTSNCKFDRKRKKKDIYVTYKVKFLACSRNDDANALMQRVNEIIINIIRDNYHHLTLLFSRKIPPIPLDIYFLYRCDRNPLLKTKKIKKEKICTCFSIRFPEQTSIPFILFPHAYTAPRHFSN